MYIIIWEDLCKFAAEFKEKACLKSCSKLKNDRCSMHILIPTHKEKEFPVIAKYNIVSRYSNKNTPYERGRLADDNCSEGWGRARKPLSSSQSLVLFSKWRPKVCVPWETEKKERNTSFSGGCVLPFTSQKRIEIIAWSGTTSTRLTRTEWTFIDFIAPWQGKLPTVSTYIDYLEVNNIYFNVFPTIVVDHRLAYSLWTKASLEMFASQSFYFSLIPKFFVCHFAADTTPLLLYKISSPS